MTTFFSCIATATAAIYTLSLHDALPIWADTSRRGISAPGPATASGRRRNRSSWVSLAFDIRKRSEEHTSELQSRLHLVCRLLLEKKKNKTQTANPRPDAFASSFLSRAIL